MATSSMVMMVVLIGTILMSFQQPKAVIPHHQQSNHVVEDHTTLEIQALLQLDTISPLMNDNPKGHREEQLNNNSSLQKQQPPFSSSSHHQPHITHQSSTEKLKEDRNKQP